jgi:S1-C subfamily serine protease
MAVQSGTYELREGARRSVLLQRLNTMLPPSGGVIDMLAAFDPFPRINGPEADVARPSRGIVRDPEVEEASASVVKVLGTACGLGVEGSGWVAAPGVVVTNAHVVAGERDTEVLPGGREPGLRAQAVHFDARNDLAVLRVRGLTATPLPLNQSPRAGLSAAILGFPLNGPFDVRPGRVGQTQRVRSSDAYGRGPVERRMTALRGLVRSGNSGGPMVDGEGRVVTTIFAATTRGPLGGYGVPNAIVARALANLGGPVSTGPCAG